MGERVLCKHEVVGSIPSASTKSAPQFASSDRRPFRRKKFRVEISISISQRGLFNIVKRKFIRVRQAGPIILDWLRAATNSLKWNVQLYFVRTGNLGRRSVLKTYRRRVDFMKIWSFRLINLLLTWERAMGNESEI